MNEPLKKSSADDRRQMYRDGIEMVNAYIKRFARVVGAELEPLDQDGYTDVRHGRVVIGITADAKRDALLLLVRVSDLEQDDPAAYYQALLELNFVATGSCSFAIDTSRKAVYLRAMRTLTGLDYTEFEELLRTIAALAEDMDGKLRGFGGLHRA